MLSLATIDRTRAGRCAEQTVRRAPSHELGWRRLAYLRLQSGDLDGAFQAAERLLELGDHSEEWNLFKGHVLAMQGRLREAIEQYTQVLTAGSAASKAHVHRADAYRRLGEHEKAVEDYTRQLEYEGEATASVWYLYQRATPLWILGRTEEALGDYRRVRTLLGRPFYSDARRILMLRELGRTREAETVLTAALRDVEDEWLRSIFRCLAGEIAPEALVAAVRGGPEQLCEARYYAGEVCLGAGRSTEARQWFERRVHTGISFDPNVFPPVPMNEHELAGWRLATLLAAPDDSEEN